MYEMWKRISLSGADNDWNIVWRKTCENVGARNVYAWCCELNWVIIYDGGKQSHLYHMCCSLLLLTHTSLIYAHYYLYIIV